MPVLGIFTQGSQAKLYVPIKNVQGASITTGYPVALAQAAGSFDGNQAVYAISTMSVNVLSGFLGVMDRDLAAGAYGICQAWGPIASVYISSGNTSATINVGDPLVPGPAGLASAAPTFALSGFRYVIASNVPANTWSVAAPQYASGFVRCF